MAEVQIDIDPGLPPVECYPSEFNQALLNLIVNAAQAIEGHGRIGVKTWADKSNIYISITDTGVGIPASQLNRIFEPFFTTKDVGKGTGLGLSVSYDIIKKHGGDICVDSRVGEGTTFTISLPLNGDGPQ